MLTMVDRLTMKCCDTECALPPILNKVAARIWKLRPPKAIELEHP